MQFTTITLLGLSALATALPTTTILEPVEVRAAPPLKTLPVQGPKSFAIRAASPQVLDTRNANIIRDTLYTRDARAATIFKQSNIAGQSTFLPANNYCTNISNIFGGFDGNIRSLSVEKGHKCDFYQEEGCGINDLTGGGAVLEVGFRGKKDVRRQLGSWEGKIASVYCQKL